MAITEEDRSKKKFDINPNLTVEEKFEMLKLLEEYSDCFASNPKKPTATNVGEHVIKTTPDARPVKAKRFRMSPQDEEEVNKQVEQMVETVWLEVQIHHMPIM